MAKRLTKSEVEKKIKHHKARTDFYNGKLSKIEKESKRIGFKHYD